MVVVDIFVDKKASQIAKGCFNEWRESTEDSFRPGVGFRQQIEEQSGRIVKLKRQPNDIPIASAIVDALWPQIWRRSAKLAGISLIPGVGAGPTSLQISQLALRSTIHDTNEAGHTKPGRNWTGSLLVLLDRSFFRDSRIPSAFRASTTRTLTGTPGKNSTQPWPCAARNSASSPQG